MAAGAHMMQVGETGDLPQMRDAAGMDNKNYAVTVGVKYRF